MQSDVNFRIEAKYGSRGLARPLTGDMQVMVDDLSVHGAVCDSAFARHFDKINNSVRAMAAAVAKVSVRSSRFNRVMQEIAKETALLYVGKKPILLKAKGFKPVKAYCSSGNWSDQEHSVVLELSYALPFRKHGSDTLGFNIRQFAVSAKRVRYCRLEKSLVVDVTPEDRIFA